MYVQRCTDFKWILMVKIIKANIIQTTDGIAGRFRLSLAASWVD